MHVERPDVLLIGIRKPVIVDGLSKAVNLHFLVDAQDKDAFLRSIAGKVRAFAVSYTSNKIDPDLMGIFPKLEIISTFGVGYDHIDAKWAGAHGIIVTNTPDVLNEEVADTALGLLINTVREIPQAERHLRAGKWPVAAYRLSKGTLRIARSAWSAWAGLVEQLQDGSKHSECLLSTTAVNLRRKLRTNIIRSLSI